MRTSIFLTLLLSGTWAHATTMADQILAGAAIGCTTQGVVPIREHSGGVQFRIDSSENSYSAKSWTIEPGVSGSPILSRVQETTRATHIQFDNSGSGCTLRLSPDSIPGATDVSVILSSTSTDARGSYRTAGGEKKNLVCNFTLASYDSLKKACLKAFKEFAPRPPKTIVPGAASDVPSAN